MSQAAQQRGQELVVLRKNLEECQRHGAELTTQLQQAKRAETAANDASVRHSSFCSKSQPLKGYAFSLSIPP